MKYTLNEQISVKTIEDEVFIYDRSSTTIHSFNETGAFLWKAVAEETDSEQVIAKLMAEFDVDSETAQNDVEKFIRDLESKALLTIRE